MNIIFLSHYFYPHVGGVEKHVLNVGKKLTKHGDKVTVITEKYNNILKKYDEVENINIVRFKCRNIKGIGLISIWLWLYKNRNLIKDADIIHCHDVFIWYLPFKFIYPTKKVFTTIHGFEWDNPFRKISLQQKRIAINLSYKVIGIGHFLSKYLNIKFDHISYGASYVHDYETSHDVKKIVYVGRLEVNTGILEFLIWLNKNPGYNIDFCGDGPLRKECEKYGKVHGFVDPTPYYKKAEYVVPGGYLAALEALNYGCKLKLYWNNKLKEDYWKMSPFYKLKGKKLYNWARAQTWDKLANEYLDLYNSIK